MAKLYLNTTNSAYKVSNTGDEVYGTSGTQIVTIDSGVTGIVLDGNVEGAKLSGAIANYDYKQTGNILEIYNTGTTTLVTKVPVQEPTTGNPYTKLTFANGSVDVKFNASNGILIGDALVNATTAQTVTPSASTITATDNSGTTPTPVAGSTFTLTSGADYADTNTAFLNGGLLPSSFKFTSGNEVIYAAGGTFSNADIFVDNTTTDNDVLSATLTGSSPIAANLTNIETLKLNLASNGSGLDFTAITAAKTIEISGTQNGTLSNVAAAAPAVTLTGGYNKTLTVAFDTLAGSSTSSPESMTVNLDGAGSSVALQIGIEGTSNTGSLEQLTINSAGSAANTLTLGTADLDGTGVSSYASASGITKITVTGSQALTLKTDHATLSSKTLEKTGTGALVLDIDRGAATSAITSLAQASGYSSVVLRGTGDVNVTGIVNGATVTLVDSFAGTGADALSVKGASTGTADSLTLVLDHKTDSTNLTFGAAFAVNDVETLSIVSNGGDATGNTLGDTTSGFEANAAKTISLSGDTKLTLNLDTDDKFETLNVVGAAKYAVDFVATSSVSYDSGKNVTVNANTSTADLTLNLSQIALATAVGTVEKMTVATGTGADTITVGSFAGAQLNLDAGDGANVISAGSFGAVGTDSSNAYTSANTIATGAGNDTITIGNVQADATYVKASVVINAGNGDNTVVVTGDGAGTANISGEISITTGTGKDTIVFGASATATSFEATTAKLTVTTGAGDDTVKLHNVTKNGSTIDLGDGVDKLYVGVAATGTVAIVNDVAITTGAGKDTIYLSNTASGVTTTAGNLQKITITDFTAGTTGDVLNLTGWTGTSFASSFGTATAGVTSGLVKLGAFDLANITAMGSSNAFNVSGTAVAVAVLFDNNTGLTEVWMAYDPDGASTAASPVAEKIATLENVTLTGIADLKIENFDFT